MQIEFTLRDPKTYWARLVKAEHLIVEAPSEFVPEARWTRTKLPVHIGLYPENRLAAWWDERLRREVRYLED